MLLGEANLTREGDAMISFRAKGDFSKLNGFLERSLEKIRIGNLDRYGRRGVRALQEATPLDTGKTADSWSYEIVRARDQVRLCFLNSNIQNGCPIAIILQYGHSANGAWVEGRDYINPAVAPIFDEIAKDAWKEVTTV